MLQPLDVSKLPNPIMIVSPHPDDDILGSAGLIQRALRAGKTIYVVYLTNGDGNKRAIRVFLRAPLTSASFIRLGFVRHQEAINAERFLGVPESHLFFLGFPDTKTLQIANNPFPNQVIRSENTLFTSTSYPFSFRPNIPYTKANEFALMKQVIEKVKPGTLIINRPEDFNPDHQAARILALSALKGSKLHPLILSYLIHFPHWPGKGLFSPPVQLRNAKIYEILLTKQELQRKIHAFALHASEDTKGSIDRALLQSKEFFWLGSNPI
jgi:LmbE family N-acetylglucosaminyl deacetylase